MINLSPKSRAVKFFGISVALLVMANAASQTAAVEYGGFGGRPAYPRADNPRTESIFVHTLKPGESKDEGVLTVNNSSESRTILVYAVDSTPSTGGAFACAQSSEEKQDVGAWIVLEKSEVVLEPGTNELIPFTISVPESASVGEHNGCIVMQEKKAPAEAGSGASLSFRTGLRVAVTVPGEITRRLEIVGFSKTKNEQGGFLLHPFVKNLGNVSVDAEAVVTTRYFFGALLARHGGQYPILRGETSDWNFELPKPFWGGWYRSDFSVEYDENPEAGVGVQSGKTLTRLAGPAIWFWSAPTLAAAAIEIVAVLLIAGGIFLLWRARRQSRWMRDNWVSREVKAGEDIKSLAEKFKVSWKLIAKANKLQAPYAFKAGSKIKVPPVK